MRHIVAGLYCAIVKGNIVMVGQYPLLFNVVCSRVYIIFCYHVFFLFLHTTISDSYNTAAVILYYYALLQLLRGATRVQPQALSTVYNEFTSTSKQRSQRTQRIYRHKKKMSWQAYGIRN